MSESKDHWQNQVAGGAFGFDVRMEGLQQVGCERQIGSTSGPILTFAPAWGGMCDVHFLQAPRDVDIGLMVTPSHRPRNGTRIRGI
jgi:hypothetical protein